VVSKIFNEKELRFRGPNLPLPMRSIYTDLLENSWHSLVIVSIGSMLGGLCMIKLVKRISPRKIQIYGFLGLALLFVVIGILFHTIPRDGSSLPIMALLYIVSQFFFEVGPNFTTFMLPAELFPTRFRCTAHGISAAAGKVASVLVQVFAAYAPIGRHRAYDPSVTWLGWVVIIFAMFMILGAGLTKWLIPETRLEHGENQPLEDLEDKAKLLVPVKRRQRAEPTEDEVDAAIEQPGTVAANEPTTQS
jgi:PHS family inorganic phosphate transporter-like MFS transporter